MQQFRIVVQLDQLQSTALPFVPIITSQTSLTYIFVNDLFLRMLHHDDRRRL